jgi:hypothetical protein
VSQVDITKGALVMKRRDGQENAGGGSAATGIISSPGYNPGGADILAALLGVDGTGSLLDADLLDGHEASYFALSGHSHSGIYEPANSNIQTHISSTSNPHNTTATQVGLGSVTNESKATMFTNPTFTGTASATTLHTTTLLSDHIGEHTTSHGVVFDNTVTMPASVIIPDGGTIGQAAGPLLNFDDTNNYLEITGCNVGINTTSPHNKLDVLGTISVRMGGVGTVASPYESIGILGSNSVGDTGIALPSINFLNTWSDNNNAWMNFHVRNATADCIPMMLNYDGTVKQPSFTAGFQGTNWQVTLAGAAEFNSMLIRGSLTVKELILNQLRYQDGGLLVGAGGGKVKSVYSSTLGSEVLYMEDPQGSAMIPFTDGAIVLMQVFNINRTTIVKKIVRQVSATTNGRVSLTTTTGWTTGNDAGVFETGDVVVVIGHTSTAAYSNNIYMSAVDSDNPFIRMQAGVDSYSKWSLGTKTSIKLQIGNLAGLASYDIVPASPGHGLYCSNVYLSGMIVATSGNIGGWDITSTYLKKDTGTEATSSGLAPSDYPFYAGATYANRATAPFRITPAGALTATGIAELGTATASYGGKTSNIAIKNADIWENSYNSDSSAIHVNRFGYNGGATVFRDFRVYDGKGSVLILDCQGAVGTAFIKRLDVSDTAVFWNSLSVATGYTATFNGYIRTSASYNTLFSHPVGLGNTPNTYACLDLQYGKRASGAMGTFIIPILTTTERNALTGTNGMMHWNSITNNLEFYYGGWKSIALV